MQEFQDLGLTERDMRNLYSVLHDEIKDYTSSTKDALAVLREVLESKRKQRK